MIIESKRIDTVEQFWIELGHSSGNFSGFDIYNITLDKPLTNIIFDHCYLEKVDFRESMNKIVFNHCELSDCEFLGGQDFTGCSFLNTDITCCRFSHGIMKKTYMAFCEISNTNFEWTDLSDSNFNNVLFHCTNLNRTNLSGVKGLIAPSDFMARYFEKTEEGYIVYKSFGHIYASPSAWKIEKGAIIEEEVNYNRSDECGSGINVANLDYVLSDTPPNYDIWRCLIRWEWTPNICVPYNSNENCARIRCGKLELIEVVE